MKCERNHFFFLKAEIIEKSCKHKTAIEHLKWVYSDMPTAISSEKV